MREHRLARGSLWWALACILLFVTTQCSGFACHAKCNCIWRKGKQTVECPGASFEKIPVGLDAGVQVLDLTRNNFTILPPNAFLNAGLLNLQRIYLSKCGVEHLDDFALNRISNLVELDLSENLISYIPTAAFRRLPLLRHLILTGNPLTIVPTQAFAELTALTILEMSNCKIDTVAIRAFEGLDKLEVLKLDSNELQTLHGKTMIPLRSLHGITLDGNPWTCDCELRGLRQWLDSNNVPYISPTCYRPTRLRDKTWTDVNIEEYACSPTFLNTSSAMNVFEGSSVSLECKVAGDPIPVIHWMWRERVITNLSEGISSMQTFIVTEHWEREKVSKLKISSVQEPNAGVYMCIAENLAGRLSKNFTLMVSRIPVTGVKIVEEEKTEEVKEEEEDRNNSVAGIAVGVVAGAVIVLVILSVVLWFCRSRRRRSAQRKRIEVNHKLGNSVNPTSPKEPQEDADLKLLGMNPMIKTPRLGGYEGIPTNDMDHYDPIVLDSTVSPHVWMVPDHLPPDMDWDPNTCPQPMPPPPTDKHCGGVRSPIPIPLPLPPEDLHTRLHTELADTLRRKGDRRVMERERGDGSSEMETTDNEGNKGNCDTLPMDRGIRLSATRMTTFHPERGTEERGPDIIDHALREPMNLEQQESEKNWRSTTPPQPWSMYEHPSAYYGPHPTQGKSVAPASSLPPCVSGGEAESNATEV